MWFTIRWWRGWKTHYNFDIVDVPSRKLYAPRFDLKELSIQVEFMHGWVPVITIEEAMARSRGLERLPGGTGEERYEVPGGSRMLFSRTCAGGRRQVVADFYAPRDENAEEVLGPRPETISPLAL